MLMMSSSNGSYRSIHGMSGKVEERANISYATLMTAFIRRHVFKAIVGLLLIAFLSTSFLIAATSALPNTVSEAGEGETAIAVGNGDTLWGIAGRYSEGERDTRYIVYLIKERNGLQSSAIKPGQRLIIPDL